MLIPVDTDCQYKNLEVVSFMEGKKIKSCCIRSPLHLFVVILVAILSGLLAVDGNTDQNDCEFFLFNHLFESFLLHFLFCTVLLSAAFLGD